MGDEEQPSEEQAAEESPPVTETSTVDARTDVSERGALEISGSVLYRQRIALVPGAVVTVRLSDVSVADAPATTIAEQVITPEHQVPIPYSLSVDPADLDERRTFSLSARITVDDRLVWTSDTHVPVSAGATTTGIDILVVPA